MTQAGQAGRQVEETFRRFGSLINFAMIGFGFIGTLMYIGSWKTTVETDIVTIRNNTTMWQTNHDSYHRDRLADTKEVQGAVNTRLNVLEQRQQEGARKDDTLEQRLATMEKGLNSVEQNATATNKTLGEISGNMQVMKEILSRIEKKQGG